MVRALRLASSCLLVGAAASCVGSESTGRMHVTAYQAPSRPGSYGFRFVEWRPVPGRFTSDGTLEELSPLGPVTLACRAPARCTTVGETITVERDASGALPPQVEIVVSLAGFKPATMTVTSTERSSRVVLLEPEGTP